MAATAQQMAPVAASKASIKILYSESEEKEIGGRKADGVCGVELTNSKGHSKKPLRHRSDFLFGYKTVKIFFDQLLQLLYI